MSVGTVWPSEIRDFKDRQSGVPIRQLTNYRGHSHHFYFTNPGWYDNGRRLLFGSDRNNRTNLFSCQHNSTMKIQQLHPHPRFSADGSQVVFTTDLSGYGNVYLVRVPDFESLPGVQDK